MLCKVPLFLAASSFLLFFLVVEHHLWLVNSLFLAECTTKESGALLPLMYGGPVGAAVYFLSARGVITLDFTGSLKFLGAVFYIPFSIGRY